jgi:hypothetical protein
MGITAASKRWREQGVMSDAAVGVLLVVVAVLLFAPVVNQMIVQRTDYLAHITEAESLAVTGHTIRVLPHLLFQYLVIIAHTFLPGISFAGAALVINTVFYALFGLVLYALLFTALKDVSLRLRVLACVLLTLCAMLLAPITLPTWSTRNLYFGYIVTSTYHNPTQVILRPLALLQFIYAIRVFGTSGKATHWRDTGVAAAVTLLGAMAKPNFVICLLPALALFTLVRLLMRRPIGWRLLLVGIVLPATAILAFQFTLMNEGRGGFAFAPLMLMAHYSSDLLLKFALSVAFPLAVYLLYFEQARHDTALNLAWAAFACGSVYLYFFIEGRDWAAGNFLWGAAMALLIVFVMSLLLFIRVNVNRNMRRFRDARAGVCIVLLALHVICGLLWYSVHASGQMTTLNIGLPLSWW